MHSTRNGLGFLARRSKLRIGTRLTACFVAIVVMMIAADAVAVWQLRQVAAPTERLSNADQTSLAVVRVHLDVDSFRDGLAALTSSHDARQFAIEAASLQQTFLRHAGEAERMIRLSPEIEQDAIIPSALETLRTTLPSQLDTEVQLANAGDWTAVQLRRRGQIQDLINLSSSLVERVNEQVLQERAKAIEATEQARHRLFLIVPVAGLLTLLAAAVLGWYVTRTITVPLSQLAAGAQALARGDFRREVDVGGNDELAVVGRAFNHAARQLQELYEELRDSEEQWRAAFQSNPTMYFIVDEPCNIVTVNSFGAEKLGYNVGELLGQPVLNVFYEPDRDAVQQHVRECFKQPGQTMRWEARKIRKDGTMLWVRETANAASLKKQPVLLVVCEDITEQKRAEEAARRSESELRGLIENVPAMVFIALPGPSNAFVSRGWREYTGLSGEDTAGSGWQSVVHPEDLERHMEQWRVCSATGEPYENETRFRRAADGEYRWFLVRAVPLRDEAGNILKWYGVLADIEDRKQAEEKIRQSEAELRQLIDVIPQQVFVFDADWSPLFANRRELEYTGLGSQEVRSKEAVARIFHPEDLRKLEVIRERALSAGAPIEMEARIRGKDGGYRWFLIRDNPLRDEQGRVLRWYGTRTDIEDRKRAEQEVRRSEDRLREVIDTIPSLVWSAQPDGGIDFINQRWGEYTGLSLEEGLGWKWGEAVHPDDVMRFMDEWRAALASGEPMRTEARVRRADGEYRWLLIRSVPLHDELGNIVKWYGSSTDIDDGKRAEEALRKAEAELAHVTRVTTMGEMVASIAHEVNQPLFGIITNGNACQRWLAGDSPDLDEARDAARRIVRDANRASDVIARVRALLRKSDTAKAKLDVNHTIREIVTLTQGEARRKGVTISMDLAVDVPPVSGDRVQLQQVILNLILNGVDAMASVSDRPRELLIASREHPPDKVLVTVQDSGPGIDPQSLEKIFDAFYTTKPQGMGMGLAISRSIVERHGGRLWAEPNQGPGATFQFTLLKYP